MPLPAYIKERQKDPNNPLKARAKALGLTMIDREVLPSTRRSHEAAEFARDRGLLEPMHASLLRRYWTSGENLYDLQVLRAAASEVGLDPDELERAIEGQSYTAAVERAVGEAQALGVRAVPLFVVRDELAIEGAQEERVFRQAFAQLGIAPKAAT